MHTYDFDGLDLDWVGLHLIFAQLYRILIEAGIPSSR
jgi:hypothetical protein